MARRPIDPEEALRILIEQASQVGQEQEIVPKRHLDVPPDPQPPTPSPSPAHRISPEESAKLQQRNALVDSLKTKGLDLIRRAHSKRAAVSGSPAGNPAMGTGSEEAISKPLYQIQKAGDTSSALDNALRFLGTTSDFDPSSLYSNELRDIESLESEFSKFERGNPKKDIPIPQSKIDRANRNISDVESQGEDVFGGQLKRNEQTKEAALDVLRRAGRQPAGRGQDGSTNTPIPPEMMNDPEEGVDLGAIIGKGHGSLGPKTKDDLAYDDAVQEAAIIEQLMDAQDKKTADDFAKKEVAEMNRFKMTGPSAPEETPYDRYMNMLSKPVETPKPGVLDILAVLGQGVAGAKPDDLMTTIDSLQGGPLRRENLQRAGTAAGLYSQRHEAQANREQGLQREFLEQSGATSREMVKNQGVRSNLEYEQGQINKRHEGDLGLKRELSANELAAKGSSQKMSISDMIALIKMRQDSFDPAMRYLQTQHGALMNDENLRLANPEKYHGLERENARLLQMLEEEIMGDRATFLGGLQSGDPSMMFAPAAPPKTYQDIIKNVDSLMKMRKQ